MLVLALLLVLIIGFYNCFNEAKLAWKARKNTGLTVFERRSNICKAGSFITLAVLALISLCDTAKGVFW
ncbi:hypothetical protein JZM36_01455 [Acinetobacter pittii]|uniref:hypothetical protein n=1 Tax=Acinetobacter pittii TaxID=48296 RepID=UPI00197DD6BA|nr:hypothetical protein [Acinetobacter pittii]MBN6515523.1 hypothetical protein [Acinetobacter pittii]